MSSMAVAVVSNLPRIDGSIFSAALTHLGIPKPLLLVHACTVAEYFMPWFAASVASTGLWYTPPFARSAARELQAFGILALKRLNACVHRLEVHVLHCPHWGPRERRQWPNCSHTTSDAQRARRALSSFTPMKALGATDSRVKTRQQDSGRPRSGDNTPDPGLKSRILLSAAACQDVGALAGGLLFTTPRRSGFRSGFARELSDAWWHGTFFGRGRFRNFFLNCLCNGCLWCHDSAVVVRQMCDAFCH